MSSEFTRFCPLADVPVGGKKAAKINDTWVMVCNTNDGLFAVSAICSHQDKPLFNGRVRNCKVTCPVHGARFDLKTGEPLDLPATKPIATYEVRVVDDWVEVCL
ncbi:Rieske (2Fe-2S) protein [Mangrovimicrobium sediminis]|uniref:Rieske (2Fe-2S) protein n=1 Tax=Mangrovimicrobium sediminis TaxID=2562682 RepID=UPI00197CB741|nr:non-heme iron oxygenase ferredoxin subunit [Haliea sp. SAOS-164]